MKTFSDKQDSKTVPIMKDEAMASRSKGFSKARGKGMSQEPRARSQPRPKQWGNAGMGLDVMAW